MVTDTKSIPFTPVTSVRWSPELRYFDDHDTFRAQDAMHLLQNGNWIQDVFEYSVHGDHIERVIWNLGIFDGGTDYLESSRFSRISGSI
jgi:hypothetical protein